MAYCNVATDVYRKWLKKAVEFFYKHCLDGHYWVAIDVYKPLVPKNGIAVRLNIREWLWLFTASKAWTGCKNGHQTGQYQNKDNQTWWGTSCPLRIVSGENVQGLFCSNGVVIFVLRGNFEKSFQDNESCLKISGNADSACCTSKATTIKTSCFLFAVFRQDVTLKLQFYINYILINGL